MKLKKALFLTSFFLLFSLVSAALYLWYFKAPAYISYEVSKFLKRNVTIKQISFLKNNTFQLSDIIIYEKESKTPFLKVNKLTASFNLSDILAGRIFISNLSIESLSCSIIQDKDNQFNFNDIVQTLSKPSEKKISWKITPITLSGNIIFQMKDYPALNLKIISEGDVGSALEKQKLSIAFNGDEFTEVNGNLNIQNKNLIFTLSGKKINLKILKHFGFDAEAFKAGTPSFDIVINGSKKDDIWSLILEGSAGIFEIKNLTPLTLKYKFDGVYSEKDRKIILNQGLLQSNFFDLVKFKGFLDDFKNFNLNFSSITKKIKIKDITLSDILIDSNISGTIESFESSGSFKIKDASFKENKFENLKSELSIAKKQGIISLKLNGALNSVNENSPNTFLLNLSKINNELKGDLKLEAPYKGETVICKISDFYLNANKKIAKAGSVELKKANIAGIFENAALSFNDKNINFSLERGKILNNKDAITFSNLNGRVTQKGKNRDFSISSVIAGSNLLINGTSYDNGNNRIEVNLKNLPLKEIQKKVGEKTNISFLKGKIDGNVSILINKSELAKCEGKISIGKTDLQIKGAPLPFVSNITGVMPFAYENGVISGSINLNIPDFSALKSDFSYKLKEFKGEVYLKKENLDINKLMKLSTPFAPTLLENALGKGVLDIELRLAHSIKSLSIDGNLILKEISLDFPKRNVKAEEINAFVPVHYNSKSIDSTKKGEGWLKLKKIESGSVKISNFSGKIDEEGNSISLNNINFDIFKGRGDGKIKITLPFNNEKISYLTILNLSGLSLKDVTSNTKGMKGEITGRVDGLIVLAGQEFNLNNISGRIDFVAKESKDEKMRISKEFLKQLGGENVALFMIGDSRNYDKGALNGIIKKGDIIFEELEISHTNIFGMQDLAVKVAPYHNKIALDHFLWTIFEASKRASGEGGE